MAQVVRVWRVQHDPAQVVLVARSLREMAERAGSLVAGSTALMRVDGGRTKLDFFGCTPVHFDLENLEGGFYEAIIDGDTIAVG